jgi:hypothetical protein
MELQAFEVNLELPYLDVVGIHRVLLLVARLIDFDDDDLGVTVSDEPLDPQGNIYAQSVDQGLVFGVVDGRLVVDPQNV